ncbi:MAG: hypothetical protein GXY98_04170 [Erysipelothrix sp.]|nr:hypothetical protein [Erysipelothrix sp.]
MTTKKTKRYIFRKLLATLLTLTVVAAIVGGTVVLSEMKKMIDERPILELSKLDTPEPTYIYDADGEQFAELGLDTSDNIQYGQLPNNVIDAFLAIEDARFFGHNGFDIARFVKSIGQNVTQIVKGGGFGPGASTITMQTIKNSFFVTKESLAAVSIDRKVQEISLAMDLEKISNKETILEFYLNKINFNVPNSRGISKAANYYFGKSVEELSLSEAAYLAGMINAPAINNAYKNIEAGTKRRNEVLNLMEYHGYITNEENVLAQSVKLENQLVGTEKYLGNVQPYQEYLDVVIEEAIKEYGLDPYSNSIKIYTALNRDQQDLVQKIEKGEFGGFEDDVVNTAMVTLNNQTGEIIAIGGGRHFEGVKQVARGFNFASMNYRQPGSVMKPILPYSLAFEYLGYGTNHVVEDGPYVFKGTNLFVNNASGRFTGDVTITTAIEQSLNIPALKTFDELASNQGIGRQAMIDYLTNLGLSNVDRLSSNYAIGAGYFEVTPIQVAGAHAAIINKGEFIEPHTITRIEVNGSTISAEPTKTKVLSEEVAYMTADVMKSAVETSNGTAVTALRSRFPIYAKSGTSSYGKEFENIGIPNSAAKDNWIAASTDNYTHVIWKGYEKNRVDNKTYYLKNPYNSGLNNAKLLKVIINNTTKFSTPKAIERPVGVKQIEHIIGVYPYVAPIEGMDPKYIVKSYIKNEFASLGKLDNIELLNLTEQSVTVGDFLISGLKIDVNMSAYPDAEKLAIVPETKTMTATAANGTKKSATGKLAFDPSWMYGPVRYGTEVKKNGAVIQSVIDEYNTHTMLLLSAKSNEFIQVCSFYTWEKNNDVRSNEVCETVSTGEQNIRFPELVGQSLSSATQWLSANGAGAIKTVMVKPTNLAQIGIVSSISPNWSKQEIKATEITGKEFTLSYYDGEVKGLNSFVNKSLGSLLSNNPFPNVLSIQADTQDSLAIIEKITVNNQPYKDFKLSEFIQIQVTTKKNGTNNPQNP